jgi:replicative DNA helicase
MTQVPPHDLDAEGVVLAAIMLAPGSYDTVEPVLTAEQFYSDANRSIFEAIADQVSKGKPTDVEALSGWLRDRNKLSRVGGSAYLVQILNGTPSFSHLES